MNISCYGNQKYISNISFGQIIIQLMKKHQQAKNENGVLNCLGFIGGNVVFS